MSPLLHLVIALKTLYGFESQNFAYFLAYWFLAMNMHKCDEYLTFKQKLRSFPKTKIQTEGKFSFANFTKNCRKKTIWIRKSRFADHKIKPCLTGVLVMWHNFNKPTGWTVSFYICLGMECFHAALKQL